MSANTAPGIRGIVRNVAGIIVLAFLTGCGTLYELDISARNPDQTPLEGTYVLVPGSDSVDVTGTSFVKYSGQVERALSGTQLRRLPIGQVHEADMAIVLDYAVGEPEAVGHTSKVPMFQQTRRPPAEDPRPGGGSNNQNNPAAAADRSEPPAQDELMGTHAYTFVRTGYWRDLSLRAISFDWKPSETPSIQKTGFLWSVTVATYGSSPDLDEVFPVMAAAAKPYFGSHDEDLITDKLNGIDKRIKAIEDAN